MRKINPFKFLIPAIFLVAIGLGNLLVGYFKYQQYDEMLAEIDPADLVEESVELSPLQRLKYTASSSSKLLAVQKKAEARRDFYKLVNFSGKIFLALSTIFLMATILTKHFNRQTR